MEERMVDLKQMLSRFLTIPGVRLAVLVGRDGLLIEGLSRDGKEDMETVGAYMTTGLNTAEVLGQEISRGGVVGVLMEYEQGLVSVDPLGDFALVVTLFDNASSISRVRHMVKATRNEILQALDIA
jgi:predicted regulator of Ras-like GTPase activity (Roadblock/LC7/MglB family)